MQLKRDETGLRGFRAQQLRRQLHDQPMIKAVCRTFLLKKELSSLEPTYTGADETNLDELARMALLVRISGGHGLED